jgi:riboflavin kinase/FMN adenylyltransferase
MNIPTANIDYPREKIIPANGIYAGWAWLDDKKYMAAINIGINPTFTPDKQTPNVEAYLLDFDRDIYGEDLTVEFIARLRDELKFDSVKELITQIQKDVAKVRNVLRTA